MRREHAWLLGRINTFLYLKEQRARRERASDKQLQTMAEDAKRALGKPSQPQSNTDEGDATDREDEFKIREFFALMESGASNGASKLRALPCPSSPSFLRRLGFCPDSGPAAAAVFAGEKVESVGSTARSYTEMLGFYRRRLLPRLEKLISIPLTSKSKREYAKTTRKTTNFFVGPNPRGSNKLVRDLIPPFFLFR